MHAAVQVLSESTWEAIRLGLTEKFLAEGQPETGKNGHVLAAVTHRWGTHRNLLTLLLQHGGAVSAHE